MLQSSDPVPLMWLDNDCGPPILVPGEYLLYWQGTNPPSAGRHIEANFRWNDPSAQATDSDRACDVNGSLGLIEVGIGNGLVLADALPTATTWLPTEGLHNVGGARPGGLLVRWIYAESDEEVLQSLTQVPDEIWVPEACTFQVGWNLYT